MNANRFTLALLLCLSAVAAAQAAPRQAALELRGRDAMSAADREVVQAHAAQVALAAAIYGYSLDDSWSYEQAVCPLAPGHVLLNYWSASSQGDSRFSAVVPREGRVVRIVPLVRAGTAPFVNPWGAHSYAVFNAITASDPGLRQRNIDASSGAVFDWGLCYVALVSQPPLAVADPDRQLHLVSAVEPTLKLALSGGTSIALTIQEDSRDASIWSLTFAPSGALIQAERERRAFSPDDAGDRTQDGSQDGIDAAQQTLPAAAPEAPSEAPVARQNESAVYPAAEPTAHAPAQSVQAVEPLAARASSPGTAPKAVATMRASTKAKPNPAPDPAANQPSSPVETTRREGRPIPDGPVPSGRPVPEGPAPVGRPVPQTP